VKPSRARTSPTASTKRCSVSMRLARLAKGPPGAPTYREDRRVGR
jgi:hypothetical protein